MAKTKPPRETGGFVLSDAGVSGVADRRLPNETDGWLQLLPLAQRPKCLVDILQGIVGDQSFGELGHH